MAKNELRLYNILLFGIFLLILLLLWAIMRNNQYELQTAYDEALDIAEENFNNERWALEELYEEELSNLENEYKQEIKLLEQEMYYLKKLHNAELKIYANDYDNYQRVLELLIEYYSIDNETDFVEWLKNNHRYLYDWGMN